MTEHTPTPAEEASAAARQARITELSRGRSAKRGHPAQGARIAAAGIGATTMLGLVGFMGYATRPAAAPAPVAQIQPQVVVVVHRSSPGAIDSAPVTGSPSAEVVGGTTLTARPTIRPATLRAQTPAASTRGSN